MSSSKKSDILNEYPSPMRSTRMDNTKATFMVEDKQKTDLENTSVCNLYLSQVIGRPGQFWLEAHHQEMGALRLFSLARPLFRQGHVRCEMCFEVQAQMQI